MFKVKNEDTRISLRTDVPKNWIRRVEVAVHMLLLKFVKFEKSCILIARD